MNEAIPWTTITTFGAAKPKADYLSPIILPEMGMTKRVGMYYDRSGWGIKKWCTHPTGCPSGDLPFRNMANFGPCIIKGPAVKIIHAVIQSANSLEYLFFPSYIYTMSAISAALKSRIRRPQLLKKVMKAEDIVPIFQDGQYLGWSGFTGVG